MGKKMYLGDGVYVRPDDIDPTSFILYTSNGIEIEHTIFFSSEMLKVLNVWHKEVFLKA